MENECIIQTDKHWTVDVKRESTGLTLEAFIRFRTSSVDRRQENADYRAVDARNPLPAK